MSKKLSPLEKESKLKVLQDCMDSMDSMMGEGLDKKKSAKKMAPVSSDSPSGDALIASEGDSESSDDEMDESPEESEEDSDEMSEEEIDAKIQALMAKKKK